MIKTFKVTSEPSYHSITLIWVEEDTVKRVGRSWEAWAWTVSYSKESTYLFFNMNEAVVKRPGKDWEVSEHSVSTYWVGNIGDVDTEPNKLVPRFIRQRGSEHRFQEVELDDPGPDLGEYLMFQKMWLEFVPACRKFLRTPRA